MARDRHSGGALNSWGRGPDSGGSTFGDQLTSEVRALIEAGDVVPSREDSPGVRAQLTYLQTRKGGRDALDEAGVSRRTARAWSVRMPGKANREKINRAYWSLKAKNWAKTGTAVPKGVRKAVEPQVQARTRGRRMTVTPVDWRDVQAQAQGAQKTASERTIRPSQRSWDNLVSTWAGGDELDMDSAWMDFASELGSPPELYYEAGHVGFSL
ncbi:hypothetical protein [Streptomyces sp. NBC_01304]|uniref:hypothetical protein n=1 Tax=Streptomyces sp. NBC_01304 TaxID=2903818 RepID=UPI002E164F1C|nr:hypothetical protein OG430_48845 [Streptomyces sp. NBC_01304]